MPFDNLGYHIYYKVLNTKDFGIPQNRERIFIVGIRDDSDNNFRFPKEIPLKLKLKDILQDNPNYAKSGLYQPYPRNYKELGLERKEQLETLYPTPYIEIRCHLPNKFCKCIFYWLI